MNSWDKNRNEQIYKQKIKSVKSTMHKMFNSPTAAASLAAARKKTPVLKKAMSNNKDNSGPIYQEMGKGEVYQKQHYLKKMLREYGLQQYLRKFYELGYDDNNIQKLANINHKDYNEFFMLVKIFPGHQVKMLAFLDNIKKMYYNVQKQNRNVLSTRTYIKKPPNSTTKRFHSVNSNRVNKNSMSTRMYQSGRIYNKPRSVETLRTNNRILRQFAQGNGFGFNYYLENEDSNCQKIEKNRENLTSAKSESRSELKSFKDDQINNINDEIDQLLNYYLVELNEKMDDSIDSIEDDDSSLSNLNSLNNLINVNINSNISSNKNVNTMKVENISEINMKNSEKSNSNINKSSTVYNILDKNSIQDEKKQVDQTPNKSVLREDSKIINKTNLSDLKQEKVGEEGIEEQFYNQYDDFMDIKEKIEEKKPEEIKEEKPTPKLTPKLTDKEKNVSRYSNNEPSPPKQSFKANGKDEEKDTPKPNYQSNENNDYSHIRLTKSCEEGYLRQNIDQFDTEYMCRCLGLALMKHLESGKEKIHIMDLMNYKENFSFFNSIFNLNIEFFNTFFSMENKDKISNLDKLDLREIEENNKKEKETQKKLEDTQTKQNEKKGLFSQPISFVSHVKKENDDAYLNESKHSKVEENSNSGGSNSNEFEKDMKLINDYFRGNDKGLNSSKYKNMNDKTKNILCQDLNSINEIDSMEYIQNNQLYTLEQKKDKTDYIELLRQSAVDFIGAGKEVLQEEDAEEIKEEANENEENGLEENERLIDECQQDGKEKNNNGKEEKFTSYKVAEDNLEDENIDEYYHQETPLHKIPEDIVEKEDPVFESGLLESNYIIDATNAEKLKNYILKTAEIYDDDYDYSSSKISHKRYVSPPDPHQIFEFCANIILLTKMEKEVIMICLIYIERLMFNTGLLLNSRNWKRVTFTALVIASKIWDDDSFENNHFAQVFTHLKIGEINLLERTFLELINYKVYVKCSEYFKYFFIIKSIALKYNFDGLNLIPISVERMMKLQEQAYQMQKRLRKKYSYNNSAQF